MILPDLNLLLYAYNPHVRQHEAARDWWSSVTAGTELIGFPDEVLFGFLRIATNRRLGNAAISLDQATSVTDSWLALPQARRLLPTSNHYQQVLDLMRKAMATGAVLSDAILAAHAIANRATLYSNDADFARFKGLDWTNPLDAA